MADGLSITVGCGRAKPQGQVVTLAADVPPAVALARALEATPAQGERWWSFHKWEGAHRGGERWVASGGVGIDLDYEDAKEDHVAPPPDVAEQIDAAAAAGLLPGSVFHLTPRGARIVFVFRSMVTDRELMSRAAVGAGAQVAAAIEAAGLPVAGPGRAGYRVDQKVLIDLARLLFTPRCMVDGVKRDARVVVMREPGFEAVDLCPPARVMRIVSPAAIDIQAAVDAYNRDHPKNFPRNGGDCPVCGHKGCFGSVPGEGSKWSCFSDSHAGAGRKGDACYIGDALDLDAWTDARTPVEHLKATGYLKAPAPAAHTLAAPSAPEAAASQPASVTALRDAGARLLKSNSYAAIVFILRTPELREKVLGRGVLEFNEMTLSVTLNRRRVEEEDYLRVRELCETELGEDESKGFKFSRADIGDAMLHVAKERRFHPVRDYLRSLVWDGVERIASLAEDVLCVNRTSLTVSLLRKWMIQAVARVEQPGCKAHGVLIFVGPGGIGKSSFFEVLASSSWFGDTAMDLNDKTDAYLKLHTTWIYEWGELESMQRARSQNTVKAFVTSPSDRFRAPYAREMEIHLRRFVLCGTANERAILTEAPGGGNRRWLIIDTPNKFDLTKLVEYRDQLWAEAFAAYNDGEIWHLNDAEADELEALQDEYMKRDPWEDRIRAWVSQNKIAETKISEVLNGAIDKRIEHWTDRDEQRIGRILAGMRWARRRKMSGGVRDYVYVNPEIMPF